MADDAIPPVDWRVPFAGPDDPDPLEGITATCAACLTEMEPTLRNGRPVWECPSCGLAKIA